MPPVVGSAETVDSGVWERVRNCDILVRIRWHSLTLRARSGGPRRAGWEKLRKMTFLTLRNQHHRNQHFPIPAWKQVRLGQKRVISPGNSTAFREILLRPARPPRAGGSRQFWRKGAGYPPECYTESTISQHGEHCPPRALGRQRSQHREQFLSGIKLKFRLAELFASWN